MSTVVPGMATPTDSKIPHLSRKSVELIQAAAVRGDDSVEYHGGDMRGRPRSKIALSASERAQLKAWASASKTHPKLAMRSRIVLESAGGLDGKSIAAQFDISEQTVAKWRSRFLAMGPDGLLDAPRSGAPRRIDENQIDTVIAKTLEDSPPIGDHWSTRRLGAELNMSQTSISRIWRTFAIQPDRADPFKLSHDPTFASRVQDIAGLYVCPPEQAIALAVAETIADTEPTPSIPNPQPAPPQAGPSTEDSSASEESPALFRSLVDAARRAVAELHPQRRRKAFLRFLDTVDASVPANLSIDLILDECDTFSAPSVQHWFANHPRFRTHLTPSPSSWMNQVERWFAILALRQFRDGTERSTNRLEDAARHYLEDTSSRPRPFVWSNARHTGAEQWK